MVGSLLTRSEIDRIRKQIAETRMTLAIIRSIMSPNEIEPHVRRLGKSLGFALTRTYSAPSSDFGFAELNSKSKILIVLWVGGPRTELVSVSETDDVHLHELEESIHSSNFYSDLVREGT